MKDESQWVRIPDAHEPVVSREMYELVQGLLGCDMRISPGAESVYLFSGLLYCADCKNPMTRKISRCNGKEEGRKRYILAETAEGRAATSKAKTRPQKSTDLTLQLPIIKYVALDDYDRRIIASLIERAEVLGKDTLHVIWKHQDEYDRILDLIS